MENKLNIKDLIKQKYFWDVDITPGKNISKRLIIERIFSYGTLSEINLLLRYYGEEEVKTTLLNLNYLDNKTLNFASKYFGLSKKEFKCYTRKQLMNLHWDF
jgi:hypothetical protein